MIPQRNAALGDYNTLALQAQAAALATVDDERGLLDALAWARQQRLPVVPLGEGSNIVLVGDIDAMVLRQRSAGIQVLETTSDKAILRVAAGENWHGLVGWCLERGYFGLENLALIPGTVGAAPIQNIGAYGVELQSLLIRVHARAIDDSRAIVLDSGECGFGYRDSIFKRDLQDRLVITAIDLQLHLHPRVDISYPALAQYFEANKISAPTPQAVYDAVVHIRSSKLPSPSLEPNAGSFFKNPLLSRQAAERLHRSAARLPMYPQPGGLVKVPAAWLIERCGWKGFRRNELGVHAQHALVLVNYGNNNGKQLLQLAREISDSVYDKFGVRLEIEPRLYGACL